MTPNPNHQKANQIAWMKTIAKYTKPTVSKSLWQVLNSFIPYFLLWGAMIYSINISYWLTLALVIPTAGFMVRIFIIFHDCGHGSFFRSQKANHILGVISGILVFTPYFQWRHAHAVHHGTSGDLDSRGVGDVWTMTVEEYNSASALQKLAYRAYRHPLVMIVIGPLFMFLVVHRFTSRGKTKQRWSVYSTNAVLIAIATGMSLLIGFKAYVLMQLPVLMIAGSAGVWLFYVQHQFEGVYWERHESWDFMDAAIQGSSFYKLPKVLQWFSGNIGFHHVHHLSSRIPNYNLEKCHVENKELQRIKPVTLFSSFKSLRYRLYDESRRKLVGFRGAKTAA